MVQFLLNHSPLYGTGIIIFGIIAFEFALFKVKNQSEPGEDDLKKLFTISLVANWPQNKKKILFQQSIFIIGTYGLLSDLSPFSSYFGPRLVESFIVLFFTFAFSFWISLILNKKGQPLMDSLISTFLTYLALNISILIVSSYSDLFYKTAPFWAFVGAVFFLLSFATAMIKHLTSR